MNRTFSLHPASLVLGLVFGVLVLLSMSQVPPLNARGIIVHYGPDPRDMVQIKQGTPYIVPAGKIFVLTGLGGRDATLGSNYSLLVNGQVEVTTTVGNASSAFSFVLPVPAGFTAAAGSTLEAQAGPGLARAWGYLAPQ